MKNLLIEKINKEIENTFLSIYNIQNFAGDGFEKINNSNIEEIYKPALSLLNSGGKRWRPIFLMLFAKMFEEKNSEISKTALKLTPLVELAHNGSLIIDDIEDSAETRRGEACAYLKYGEDLAINCGNLLYYLPTAIIDNLEISQSDKYKIYSIYSKYMRRLHFGQGLDIQWHNNDSYIPNKDEYIQMCKLKTGSLAGMSAELGVISASIYNTKIKNITENNKPLYLIAGKIAENIGVAFQIRDDIININSGNIGKDQGDDIVEKKKSLPVILYCQENESKELISLMQKASEKGINEGAEYVSNAIKLIKESGAIEKANTIAINLIKEAKEDLVTNFPDNKYREEILKLIGDFLND